MRGVFCMSLSEHEVASVTPGCIEQTIAVDPSGYDELTEVDVVSDASTNTVDITGEPV